MPHTPVTSPGAPGAIQRPRGGYGPGGGMTQEDYDALLGHVASGTPTPRSVNAPQLDVSKGQGYIPLVYGRQRVTAQPIYSVLGNWNFAYFWLAVCEGEIDAVEKFYVNGIDILTFNPNGAWGITVYAGTPSGTHDALLDSLSGITTDGFPGTAYVRVAVVNSTGGPWAANVPGGSGSITFEAVVRGRKVYDPRLDSTVPGGSGSQRNNNPATWTWSQNPPLHWRDLRVLGGQDTAQCDDAQLVLEAAKCDVTSWPAHPSPGAPRFVSNLLCDSQANLKSWIDQLALTCNGYEYWFDGKFSLFIDVENAASPLLTLNSSRNVSRLKTTWVGRRDKPTQVRIDFKNEASGFLPDYVLEPETLAPGVEPVLTSFTANAFSDRVHAGRAAAYIFNVVNATPVRMEGDATYVGIRAVRRGTKIAITSSDGVSAQEVLVDTGRETPTGWHFTIRQYDDACYSDTTATDDAPISTDLGDPSVSPDMPPVNLSAAGVDVTAPTLLPTWTPQIYFDAPRVMSAPTLYGATRWSHGAAVTNWDASKVNDGNASVRCATVDTDYNDGWVILDLGVGNAVDFCALDASALSLSGGGSTDGPGLLWDIEYSDNGSTWLPVRISYDPDLVDHSSYKTAHFFWPSVGAHRYWRAGFNTGDMLVPPGTDAMDLTELQFLTYTQVYFPLDYIEIREHDASGALLGTIRPVEKCTVGAPVDLSPYITTTFVAGYPLAVLDLWLTVVNNAGVRGTGRAFYEASTGTQTPVLPTQALVGAQYGAVATDVQLATSLAIDGDALSGTDTFIEKGSAPAVSAVGQLKLYADTSGVLQKSHNGGAYSPLVTGGGGGWTMEDSSTPVGPGVVTFTFSTPVLAGHPIHADGRLMNEAAGDYTRSGSTVTLANAPLSSVTRFFS